MINDFDTAYALVGWAVKAKHEIFVALSMAKWEMYFIEVNSAEGDSDG